MSLKTVIGLEIHVELSTKTKMFCSCKNEFGSAPNTNTCPVCLGHPGALPVMNKKAVEYALMAGMAFDCETRNSFKMDRKKYFYPDLVKGYQITQQDTPLCENGKIDVDVNGKKSIRIRRIHIEEDTGKAIHNEDGNTLMDYNRSGVPLIEIVSEPDMNSSDEGRQFLENLKERLKFLNISDVKMEEGSLRCDVNINVVDDITGKKTKITEVKNLNSFKSAVRAMEYEAQRHKEMLLKGEAGTKETRRWDEQSSSTIVMRQKEEGNDYRFSIEGDIPYIELSDEFIENVRCSIPELPHVMMERFVEQYGLSQYDADILTRNKFLSSYFEKVVDKKVDPKTASNWILSDVLRQVNERSLEIEDLKIEPINLSKLIKLVTDNKINMNTGKKILRELFDNNFDPDKYVVEKGLIQMDDSNQLQSIVDDVLKDNESSVIDYRNGKDRALGYLVGQCMKASKGKGNPQKFNAILLEFLNK